MNFWVSGEDAVNFPNWTEGVFGLKVTNVLAGDPITYLSVPSDLSANSFQRFEFFFVPLNPLAPVTIQFINWGHLNNFSGGVPQPFSTELVMDDVIVNTVPEPASLSLIAAAAIALGVGRRGH